MAFNFDFRMNLDPSNFTNGLRNAAKSMSDFGSKLKSSAVDSQMPKSGAWADVISTANSAMPGAPITKDIKEAQKQISGMRGLIEKNLLEPAKKTAIQFKDVARIVQGIIISKIFYTSLNAIRNATSAVWDFTQQLENAQITYTQLFGNTALAEEFLVVLKEFASVTPFSFKEAEAGARQLLAYGIQMKNVMYVMQGVMSASALTGNPEAVDRISRALGQIQTKGRLAAEEVRQLAEAGVPAYQILREELGLTADDMQNIGKAGIPASKAINALVDGMNKRFGGGVEALARTTSGLLNKIGDDLLQLGTRVFEPVTKWLRSILEYVSVFVARLRTIADRGGIGAVFAHLVPPELQGMIRQLIANFLSFFSALRQVASAVGQIGLQFGVVFIRALNIALPIINSLLIVLSNLLSLFANNSTAMRVLTQVLVTAAAGWAIFKVQALAAMVVAKVGQAIMGVAKIIQFLATALITNPIGLILGVIAAALIGAALASDKFSAAIANLFKSLTTLTGFDPDKILIPDFNDATGDIDKFSDALDGSGDSIDDLNKKMKAQLLSFDEVFRLEDPKEDNPWEDIAFPEIPEFPDNPSTGGLMDLFGEMKSSEGIFDSFTKGFNELKDAFMSFLEEGAIGKIIEGFKQLWKGLTEFNWQDVLGGLGKIGEGLKELIWDPIKKAFGFQDSQGLAALMTGIILGALGLALGGPGLATILGLVGTLGSLLFSGILNKIAEAFGKDPNEVGAEIGIGQAIGTAIGAILGGLLGGPPGAIIGAAIGNFVGGFIGIFWDDMVEIFSRGPGQAVFSAIAGAIGAVVGGPIGSMVAILISGKIGEAVTYLTTEAAPRIKEFVDNTATNISTWLSETGEGFKTWVSDSINGLTTWAKETASSIGTWVTDTAGDIGTWAINTAKDIGAWIGGTATDLGAWVSDTAKGFADWALDTGGGFITWAADTGKSIGDWVVDTGKSFVDWVSETGKSIGDWFADIGEGFIQWVQDTGEAGSLGEWWELTSKGLSEWATNTFNDISTWWSDTTQGFTEWAADTFGDISGWVTDTFDELSQWGSDTLYSLGGWWDETRWGFSSWFDETSQGVSEWVSNVATNIKDMLFVDIPNAFDEFFTDTLDSLGSWFDDTIEAISDWARNIVQGIADGFKEAGDMFGDFMDDLFGGGNDYVFTGSGTSFSKGMAGHARGGIFNKEHIAQFNEDNKTEAIIPLDIPTAMQPFVDAVASGISDSIAQVMLPAMAGSSGEQSGLPPMYVGTLIADERGLRELQRKMRLIDLQESARRGLVDGIRTVPN